MPNLVASDGVSLHYADEGRGPPIVFLHGWMMSHRFFRRQFESLAPMRRLVGLDLRGCGASEGRPGTHTMERYVEDLHDLLVGLDLTDATLVGWSLGGGIASSYLERHGAARLRGVCLIDFPPRFTEDPSVRDKVCRKLAADRDAYTQRFVKSMFLHEPAPEELRWMLAENARCGTATACEMYGQLGRGQAGGPHDLAALLVFPTSGWFPAALDEWRKVFPNGRAPTFAASRHCPFLEEPERFNQELLAFTQ